MRTGQRVTLSGRAYVIAPLPAGIALRIFARLTKPLLPVIVQLELAKQLADLSGVDFSKAMEHISDNELNLISQEFAKESQIELEPGSNKLVPLANCFDEVFGGALDQWGEWFAFCAKLNFGPLVGSASAKIKLRAAAVAPSTVAANPPP